MPRCRATRFYHVFPPFRQWSLVVTLVLFIVTPLITTIPAAAQQATAATPVTEPVFAVILDTLPVPPLFIGMARLTFPPGAHILGGPIAGTRLFLIETGTLTVALDDPGTIQRAGTPHLTEIADSGTQTTLASGDLLSVSGIPPFTITNSADVPATLLDIVLWPPVEEQVRPFITEYGVIFEPLVIGEVTSVPEKPVQLLLERTSVPRDDELSYAPDAGPMLVYVDSGRLGIHASSGALSYASSAANAPGSVVGRIRTLEPGRDAVLTAGGSVVLQSGATGIFTNLGRNQLELLVLRFQPVS